MKKYLSMIIVCLMFVTVSIGASANFYDEQRSLPIEFNGEATEYKSVFCNDVHYVPLRLSFEKMGAAVFYRSSDNQVLALSRNGDIIRHIVGDNTVTFNEKDIVFQNPSIRENDAVYIPLDMVSAVFFPDAITCDSRQIDIQKQFVQSDYHKIIQDVLNVCRNSNFHPERFQEYINYHAKMPAYSIDDVIFRVNHGLDEPFYENPETIEHPHELLVLVNKYHKLPSGFAQYNLVNMNRSYTVNDGKQYLLMDIANEKYMQMSDAAKAAGLSMKVVSAYRTEDYQRGLYNNKLRTMGRVNTDNYSARPGHSEHQTGLAVDIGSTIGLFEYTAEFRWLQQHAHEYGFILRYPKGKEWITGYAYEPWHYRYVGADVAKIIYEEGITYEEYYAKYITLNEFR